MPLQPMPSVTPTLRLQEWFRARALLLLALAAWAYGVHPVSGVPLWALVVVWLLSYLGLGSFGYFVNDCFDIEQDLAAGKHNRAAFFRPVVRLSIALLLLLLAFLPWALLPWQPWVLALLLLQVLLLCAYSIPPLRLKGRAAGMVADALYAFVVPGAITVIAFGISPVAHNPLILALLGGALFLTGLRNILLHHLRDREADAAPGSDTYNLALRLPVPILERRIYTHLIPAELVCWLAATLSLGIAGWPASAMTGIYIIGLIWQRLRGTPANPAWPNPLHDTWLPLALGGMAIYQHLAALWPLLLVFLALVPWLLLFRLTTGSINDIWFRFFSHHWNLFIYDIWNKFWFHTLPVWWHHQLKPLWYRLLATPLGKPYYFLYNMFHPK